MFANGVVSRETLLTAERAQRPQVDAAKARRAVRIAFNTLKTVAFATLGFAALSAAIVGTRVALYGVTHTGTPFSDVVLRGLGL